MRSFDKILKEYLLYGLAPRFTSKQRNRIFRRRPREFRERWRKVYIKWRKHKGKQEWVKLLKSPSMFDNMKIDKKDWMGSRYTIPFTGGKK